MKKQANNRIDMTGKFYNSWRVIEPDLEKSKGKSLYWRAECLDCNRIFTVKGANIRNGTSKRCTECGCGHGHDLQKGTIRTKRSAKESAEHYMFLQLRKSANPREIKWTLTEKETLSIIFNNCHYCASAPELKCYPLKHHKLSQKRTEDAVIIRNGIDRIDSDKGYEINNVVPCCEQCNKSKLDQSITSFMDWLDRIARHQGYTK